MWEIVAVIYAAGCVLLGFVLMRKFERFLNMIDERYGVRIEHKDNYKK